MMGSLDDLEVRLMPDSMIRATAADGRIRAVIAITTGIAEDARRRHQSSPTATVALGRALTGGLLLSAVLQKVDGRLTIRIIGDGPMGGLVVDADQNGNVRGYVSNPDVDIPLTEAGCLDVGGAIGHGFLHVTQHDAQGHPYTGTVELDSGEIGEDIAKFLAESVQTPSAVSLGLYLNREGQVEAAGGLIVQLLPGAGDEIAERLEQAFCSLPSFSQLIRDHQDPEAILRAALSGFAVEILEETSEIAFSCPCSEKRALGAIASMGREEIQAMIEEDGKAQVRCHFCNSEYNFTLEDLQELMA